MVLGVLGCLAAIAIAACGDGVKAEKPATTKQLSAFSFRKANNPTLPADVTATISTANVILAVVPSGTDVKHLVATFTTSGVAVAVAGATQISGTTANNFEDDVVYRVTAANGTSQDYTVSVSVLQSSDRTISAFSFAKDDNPGLDADVTATINGDKIALTVPNATDVTALVASFTTTGVAVTIAGITQVTGTTKNDFSDPVIYTVTAEDRQTRSYTVTVTIAPSTAKELTRYKFAAADNPGLTDDAVGTISGDEIAVTVPFGTDVTGLIATFETTGAKVTVGDPAVEQTSGATENDFTAPVVYAVTAEDDSRHAFTVTVTIAKNTAKDITAFAFKSAFNGGLQNDVIATIDGLHITATLPFGSDPTKLKASFTAPGATVTVDDAVQVSDITEHDFSATVTYKVTAADDSSQNYAVDVTVAANPAKDLTSFAFLTGPNPTVLVNTTGAIVNNAITLEVPASTDLTTLIATFATTGAKVSIGDDEQTSGISGHDFTTPVTYTVAAADGTTKNYVVTVKLLLVNFSFGNNPTGSQPNIPSDGRNPGVATAPIMRRGTGLVGAQSPNTFAAERWTTAATPAENDWIGFIVQPATNTTLTISRLSLVEFVNDTGPKQIVLRYSIDGFANFVDLGTFTTHTDRTQVLVALDQVLSVTRPIEFRVYGISADNDTTGALSLDDVQLAGTASPTPPTPPTP